MPKNNIYLLYGDEAFLIEEELLRIKGSSGQVIAMQRYRDKSLDISELLNELQAVSLFAEQKLLVIELSLILKYFSEGNDLEKTFFRVLENCPEIISVVFVGTDKVDKRKKLFKWLQKNGTVKSFSAFKPWEKDLLRGWLKKRSAFYKKKIEIPAVNILIELAGSSLAILDQELKKIAIYKGQETEITSADIKALASQGKLRSFELIDHLKRRDVKGALILLEALKRDNDPLPIMGLIISQFRLFLQIKAGVATGMSFQDLSSVAGKKPFYLQNLAKELGGFSGLEMKKLYYRLQESDLAIKQGKEQPWVAIDEFVLELRK
jgi:DNA polymerase III subunit delta